MEANRWASWRLEAWSARIALATCTRDEYTAAVSCSEPREYTFTSRAALDAFLDAIEADTRLEPVPCAGKCGRIVEAFVYTPKGRRPLLTYHRARDGAFVLAGDVAAISESAS